MKRLLIALISFFSFYFIFSYEYPENLLLLGDETDYALLVEKKNQRMFVYRGNEVKPVYVFTVTTGKNNGDKFSEGDEKTPLGVYFFTEILTGKKLPPLYGLKAFVMDYPNPFDIYESKTGSGIWLHGADDPLKPLTPFSTRGCVAMRNSDLIKVEPFITLYRTPIIVEEEVKFKEYKDVMKERKFFENFVYGWKRAWESKNIDDYMSYYSKDFRMGSRDFYEYRRFKDRLNRLYKFIKVNLYELQIVKSSKYVVASFYQEYRSDKKVFNGTKRLYIVKEGGGWKIVREYVRPSKLWKKRKIILKGKKLVSIEKLIWENDPVEGLFRVSFKLINGLMMKRGFYILLKIYNKEGGGVFVLGKKNSYYSDEENISPQQEGRKIFVNTVKDISFSIKYPDNFNPERIRVEVYDLMGVMIFSETLHI